MAVGLKVVSISLKMNKLIELESTLGTRVSVLLDKGAFDVEAAAKRNAPVDTGALRASIYVSGASRGGNYSARVSEANGKAQTRGRTIKHGGEIKAQGKFIRIVGPSVIYGIFPEVQGQAYLGPAVEEVRPNFIKAWKMLLK